MMRTVWPERILSSSVSKRLFVQSCVDAEHVDMRNNLTLTLGSMRVRASLTWALQDGVSNGDQLSQARRSGSIQLFKNCFLVKIEPTSQLSFQLFQLRRQLF